LFPLNGVPSPATLLLVMLTLAILAAVSYYYFRKVESLTLSAVALSFRTRRGLSNSSWLFAVVILTLGVAFASYNFFAGLPFFAAWGWYGLAAAFILAAAVMYFILFIVAKGKVKISG